MAVLYSCDLAFLIIFFCLFVCLPTHNSKCDDICHSKACIQFAQKTLAKLDENLNPCDDFYKFACGKYPENVIRYETGGNEVSYISNYLSMYDFLAKMIEEYSNNDTSSLEYKRKVIHQSCVDFESKKEALFINQRIFNYFIPNWPNIDEEDSVEEWLVKLSLSAEYAFFYFHISAPGNNSIMEDNEDLDANNSAPSEAASSLAYVSMGIVKKPLFFECFGIMEHGNKARDFLYDLMNSIGLQKAESKQIVDDAFQVDALFQDLLAEYQKVNTSENLIISNCTSDEAVSRWCKIIYKLVEVTNSDANISEIEFEFKKLKEFLAINKLLETVSKQALANYLATRIFIHNLGVLEFLDPFSDFPCKVMDSKFLRIKFYNRRLDCSVFLASVLPISLSWQFVHGQFMLDRIIRTKNILKELLQSLESSVNLTWIPESGQREFEEMIRRTTLNEVHYVRYVKSIGDLSNRFSDLKSHHHSVYLNMEEINRMLVQDALRNYREGIMGEDFKRLNPFYINANAGLNIHMGLGSFDIPYLGHDFPEIKRYAVLGFLLGHEIGHNLLNVLHENGGNHQAFNDYVKCITDIYSNFKIPLLNISLNAFRTLPEDAADISALPMAYNSFKTYSKTTKVAKFPGLQKYTQDQLFYIIAAQQWCEFGLDFEMYTGYSSYSPFSCRINGPAMNMNSFSEAFQCQVGSFMNHAKKCEL